MDMFNMSAGERMNVDNCNGHPYMSGSEAESLTDHGDLHASLRVPTASTPNGQQSSPNPQLSGERPFRCTECGASFTQKGNLLRHRKLHSGEKPFKCVFCNYACRRRDALNGHIRTHTVPSPATGKPFKCSYCGRSYKQQSSLQEHLERCQIYLQNLQDHQALNIDQTAEVEDSSNMEPKPELVLQSSADKLCFIDRLANSITKRKSSTPQKFVGDNHTRLNEPDRPYELSNCPEKNQEGDHNSLPSSYLGLEAGASGSVGAGLEGSYLRSCGAGGDPGSELLQLAPLHPAGPAPSDASPVSSSLYCHQTPLGAPVNGRAVVSVGLAGQKASEGHEDVPSGLSPTGPGDGCHDSRDKSQTESTAKEKRSTRFMPPTSISVNNQHHPHLQYPALLRGHPYFCPNPSSKDPGMERACPMPIVTTRVTPVKGSRSPASGSPLISGKAFVQVVDGEGRAVRSFRCEHCHVFFLDHVMFTIHMGCHGFRQPFQCNVCGHRSQDRYQFSSHIVRGEHQVG